MSSFTVRFFEGRSDLKDAFRVNLSGATLVSLKLRPGELCQLRQGDGPPRMAVAWNAAGGGIKDNIVQTSRTLQELYSLGLGDQVAIEKSHEALAVRPHLVLWDGTKGAPALSKEDKLRWELILHSYLVKAEVGNHSLRITFDC